MLHGSVHTPSPAYECRAGSCTAWQLSFGRLSSGSLVPVSIRGAGVMSPDWAPAHQRRPHSGWHRGRGRTRTGVHGVAARSLTTRALDQARPWEESNLRPLASEASALPLRHRDTVGAAGLEPARRERAAGFQPAGATSCPTLPGCLTGVEPASPEPHSGALPLSYRHSTRARARTWGLPGVGRTLSH